MNMLLLLLVCGQISLEQSDAQKATVIISTISGNNTYSGSGVVIESGDRVLSCNHILHSDTPRVKFFDKRVINATIIFNDKDLDFSILSIAAQPDITPIKIADEFRLDIECESWGYAPRHFWSKKHTVHNDGWFKSTVFPCSGDSGGPVVQDGKLIGIILGINDFSDISLARSVTLKSIRTHALGERHGMGGHTIRSRN